MIYLKLRQEGMPVNYKRVQRLYQEAKLQVRRRKRKKVPAGERQPLLRPMAANQVWSMDFVFDRTAEGRVIKCLTIVDDATHEAVAVEVERAISGHMLTRVLDRLALSRGLPSVIRTGNGNGNGKEFCGRAMVTWARERGVQLRLIQPGKPNQNAYIERFNRTFREEVLDQHLFARLEDVREAAYWWMLDYNELRPHESLGDLTPAEYSQQVASGSTFEVSA
jgi:transposase InsO family protein